MQNSTRTTRGSAAPRRAAVAATLAVALSTAVLSPAPAHAAEDFASAQARWEEMLTGASVVNLADPVIAARVESITESAQDRWDDFDSSPSRVSLWPDLVPEAGTGAEITESYGRLYSMALAFSTPESDLEGDVGLLAAIEDGLEWMNDNRYNPAAVAVADWWDWEIGSPSRLTDTVLLLRDHLDPSAIADYMAAVDHFCSDPLVLHENTPGDLVANTGYNLVSKAEVVAVRALIVEDAGQLAVARDSLSEVFDYVAESDGFYADGSFVFHRNIPYTGSYGAALFRKTVDLIYLFSGTVEHAVTDVDREHVYEWAYASFEPVMFRGALMSAVSGRAISRDYAQEHDSGRGVITSVALLAKVAAEDGRSADSEAFEALVKAWVTRDTYSDYFADGAAPISIIALVRAIMDDSSIIARDELVSAYLFAGMDRAVARREDWAFTVSMHSTRIQNYEEQGGAENLRGWHTADGMTYLYDADLGQYSGDFWPTVDSMRLPGTTVVAGSTSITRRFGESHWVGGSEFEEFLAAGQQLEPFGQDLVARKSWFAFADEVVAVGSGITSTSTSNVETIVDNRKLSSSGSSTVTIDGSVQPTTEWADTFEDVSWAHIADSVTGSQIGYYFPSGEDVSAQAELATGSWSEINSRPVSPTDERSNHFATFVVDHGPAPSGDAYEYVLLPDATSSGTAAYAADASIEVISNTADVHAVSHENGILMANFWSDGTHAAGGLTVDHSSSVIVVESGDEIAIALADPTQLNGGSVTIEFDEEALGIVSASPGVTVLQYSPTIRATFDVAGAAGATLVAVFRTTGAATANPTVAPDTVPGADEIIVDNTDPGFASERTWTSSSGSTGFHGVDYLHTGSATADARRWASWTPYIEDAGVYEVYLRWVAHSNRADAVPVQITHAGGVTATTVDQTAGGSQWVSLGQYELLSGTSSDVRISAADSGYTVADAVRFVRVTERYEAESIPRVGSGAALSNHNDGQTSAGAWNKLDADGVGDYVGYTIDVPAAGTYDLRVGAKVNDQRGIYRVYVPALSTYVGGTFDQYASATGYAVHHIGELTFPSGGTYVIRLVVDGKNSASSGYSLANDYLELASR